MSLPAVSLVPAHGRWAFPAGSTSLAQYQFVQINTSEQLVTPATTGVFAVVLDDAPQLSGATQGSDGEYSGGYTVGVEYGVVFQGVQKVRTGANLAAGVPVMTDTNGKAIAAVTGAVILGWTLFASNSGDIAPILLDRSIHN